MALLLQVVYFTIENSYYNPFQQIPYLIIIRIIVFSFLKDPSLDNIELHLTTVTTSEGITNFIKLCVYYVMSSAVSTSSLNSTLMQTNLHFTFYATCIYRNDPNE